MLSPLRPSPHGPTRIDLSGPPLPARSHWYGRVYGLNTVRVAAVSLDAEAMPAVLASLGPVVYSGFRFLLRLGFSFLSCFVSLVLLSYTQLIGTQGTTS